MAIHPSIGNGTGSGNTQVTIQSGSQAKLVSTVDGNGNLPNFLPFGYVYNYTIIDVPGATAANNFLSVFNPPSSLRTLALLSLAIESYSTGSSPTANSMAGYRTTSATGIPAAPAPPPISNGAGAIGVAAFTPASGAALAVAHPGEGVVFRTVAGNANQMWNISITWLEF